MKTSNQIMSSSDPVAYYDENATKYFDQVVGVDTSEFLGELTRCLVKGSLIIDAGCGSGRDTKWLRDQGFSVYPFDAAASLANLAAKYTKAPVHVHRFKDLKIRSEAQAVIAMASLLFLDAAELVATMVVMTQALTAGGYMLASFKEGKGMHAENGRIYHDKTVDDATWLAQACGMTCLRAWAAEDKLGRQQRWVYFLFRKNQQVR